MSVADLPEILKQLSKYPLILPKPDSNSDKIISPGIVIAVSGTNDETKRKAITTDEDLVTPNKKRATSENSQLDILTVENDKQQSDKLLPMTPPVAPPLLDLITNSLENATPIHDYPSSSSKYYDLELVLYRREQVVHDTMKYYNLFSFVGVENFFKYLEKNKWFNLAEITAAKRMLLLKIHGDSEQCEEVYRIKPADMNIDKLVVLKDSELEIIKQVQKKCFNKDEASSELEISKHLQKRNVGKAEAENWTPKVCPLCVFEVQEESVWQHIVKVHVEWERATTLKINRGSTELFCTHCFDGFDTYEDLMRHEIKIHGASTDNSCPFCGLTCQHIFDYYKHVVGTHGHVYQCKTCKEEFCLKSDINLHNKHLCHGSLFTSVKPKYFCPFCNARFFSSNETITHLFNNFNANKLSPSTGLRCFFCKVEFETEVALKVHLKQSVKCKSNCSDLCCDIAKPIFCFSCKAKFENLNALEFHQSSAANCIMFAPLTRPVKFRSKSYNPTCDVKRLTRKELANYPDALEHLLQSFEILHSGEEDASLREKDLTADVSTHNTELTSKSLEMTDRLGYACNSLKGSDKAKPAQFEQPTCMQQNVYKSYKCKNQKKIKTKAANNNCPLTFNDRQGNLVILNNQMGGSNTIILGNCCSINHHGVSADTLQNPVSPVYLEKNASCKKSKSRVGNKLNIQDDTLEKSCIKVEQEFPNTENVSKCASRETSRLQEIMSEQFDGKCGMISSTENINESQFIQGKEEIRELVRDEFRRCLEVIQDRSKTTKTSDKPVSVTDQTSVQLISRNYSEEFMSDRESMQALYGIKSEQLIFNYDRSKTDIQNKDSRDKDELCSEPHIVKQINNLNIDSGVNNKATLRNRRGCDKLQQEYFEVIDIPLKEIKKEPMSPVSFILEGSHQKLETSDKQNCTTTHSILHMTWTHPSTIQAIKSPLTASEIFVASEMSKQFADSISQNLTSTNKKATECTNQVLGPSFVVASDSLPFSQQTMFQEKTPQLIIKSVEETSQFHNKETTASQDFADQFIKISTTQPLIGEPMVSTTQTLTYQSDTPVSRRAALTNTPRISTKPAFSGIATESTTPAFSGVKAVYMSTAQALPGLATISTTPALSGIATVLAAPALSGLATRSTSALSGVPTALTTPALSGLATVLATPGVSGLVTKFTSAVSGIAPRSTSALSGKATVLTTSSLSGIATGSTSSLSDIAAGSTSSLSDIATRSTSALSCIVTVTPALSGIATVLVKPALSTIATRSTSALSDVTTRCTKSALSSIATAVVATQSLSGIAAVSMTQALSNIAMGSATHALTGNTTVLATQAMPSIVNVPTTQALPVKGAVPTTQALSVVPTVSVTQTLSDTAVLSTKQGSQTIASGIQSKTQALSGMTRVPLVQTAQGPVIFNTTFTNMITPKVNMHTIKNIKVPIYPSSGLDAFPELLEKRKAAHNKNRPETDDQSFINDNKEISPQMGIETNSKLNLNVHVSEDNAAQPSGVQTGQQTTQSLTLETAQNSFSQAKRADSCQSSSCSLRPVVTQHSLPFQSQVQEGFKKQNSIHQKQTETAKSKKPSVGNTIIHRTSKKQKLLMLERKRNQLSKLQLRPKCSTQPQQNLVPVLQNNIQIGSGSSVQQNTVMLNQGIPINPWIARPGLQQNIAYPIQTYGFQADQVLTQPVVYQPVQQQPVPVIAPKYVYIQNSSTGSPQSKLSSSFTSPVIQPQCTITSQTNPAMMVGQSQISTTSPLIQPRTVTASQVNPVMIGQPNISTTSQLIRPQCTMTASQSNPVIFVGQLQISTTNQLIQQQYTLTASQANPVMILGLPSQKQGQKRKPRILLPKSEFVLTSYTVPTSL